MASIAVVGLAPVASAPAGAAPAGVSVPQAARISGVDLQTFNDTNISPDFAKIAADGANMVNITVWWQVPTMSSNSIAPSYPNISITDAKLIALAMQAESAGLQVSITPDFVVGANTWRGKYDPSDPSAFFASYTQMVDHYADISSQLKMPMYWIGSEMIDSEKYTSQWESVIQSVRQHYSGMLLYDVNWSNLDGVDFYGALDAMSVSAYFPLSKASDPTLDQLLAAWNGANPTNQDWVTAMARAQKRWGKPVYFGESGYSASTYSAQTPYTEVYDSSDPQLQYRCYEALQQTFRGDSYWGGVLWWAWDGGVYNMDGEPAESLIGTRSVAYPAPAPAPAPVGRSGGGAPASAPSATGAAATSGGSRPGAATTGGSAANPGSAAIPGTAPTGGTTAVPVGTTPSSPSVSGSLQPPGSAGGAIQGSVSPGGALEAAGGNNGGLLPLRGPRSSASSVKPVLVAGGIAIVLIAIASAMLGRSEPGRRLAARLTGRLRQRAGVE